ncbi:L-dopachrome tautomerase yellow-f2 [Agrilus planipennis]|uniref:L-dopachrome tautomerase yellow-f2 n=1 Tax=Agrilus planipennis TaxID=224129 RepID=A0A1W4XHZ1_AGRPL|nr:L-dopachrome tautomerase yellow-f2 [Agrilus planipennis]
MLIRSVFLVVTVLPLVWSLGLREEFTWTRINYVMFSSRYNVGRKLNNLGENTEIVFPSDDPVSGVGSELNQNDDYIYENNIPMGANRWEDKLFITVPRRRNGVPSTLNYVSINSRNRHNVPLIPYPDAESNMLRNDGTNGIVSVYRVAVDVCDRLWMVDTGTIELPGNITHVQPPSILIFDLKTDRLIRKYVLKERDYTSSSTLADVTIDVTRSDCTNAYAYIPDVGGYGMIVYSFHENDSWRVTHNYFYLEPIAGEMSIGGFKFQWNDGIFSIALGSLRKDGFRTAYFHSMAGISIYAVSTRILRNKQLATRSYHGDDFKVVGRRELGYQSSSSALYQSNGVLFLGLVNKNALGCIKTGQRLMADPVTVGIVQRDDNKMIYPCDVKIYKNDVILLTNTMPVFLYGNLDYSQVNFRVWMENVDKALEGTGCLKR